ncbi:AraC family transcriptional regulator [Curtobacterium ammoniigenes]|uniref:AraC family transcriptional regulator n=1 Tax=Curtobacterium ammoniigenes TaxID=395387 RepID=UPI000833A126|nr:helix-turn-helix domain-containing protein [Curtobacterium ammoniigenes]
MPSDSLPILNFEQHGHSIDEAVDFYEHVYDSNDIHFDRSATNFGYRYRAVGDGAVTLGSTTVDARRWGTIPSGRQYFLAWTSTPGVILDPDGAEPTTMIPGIPVMYPAGRPFTFDAPPTTQNLVRFEGDFLEAVAAARIGRPPAPLRFRRAASPERIEQLRQAIATHAPVLLDPASDRAVRTRANLLVAEAVVEAYDARPAPSALAGGKTLRAAQEFIAAHAAEPLTIIEIAAAVDVGTRTLQASFQRHLHTSPLVFLRETRLHRVRAQLLMHSPLSTSVASQALAHGFRHLGRFSAYYSDQFGEAPSETLRRRRLL